MCKKLKIKFIIAIIATIILALVIPSIKNESLAVERTDDYVKGTFNTNKQMQNWDELVKSNDPIIVSSSFFRNKYTFCIQHGQTIKFGSGDLSKMHKYKIEGLTIEGAEKSCLNGLAYILSQESERKTPDTEFGWQNYQNDPIQLALWAYLNVNRKHFPSTYKEVFPDQKNITINTEKEYIEGKTSEGNKIGGNNVNGKKAYKIYKEATKEQNKYYRANVWILTDIDNKNAYQKLMLVEKVEIENKDANLKIKINKVVDKGTPEKKFQFKVEFLEGDKYEKAKLKKTEEKFISNGNAKTFSYKADTTKNVYVEITETNTDENYDAAGPIIIKYEYDSSKKRWEFVNMWGDGVDNLCRFGSEDGYNKPDAGDGKIRTVNTTHEYFEIKVENKWNPKLKLFLIKADSSDKEKRLGGAEIEVKLNDKSNIDKVYYWENDNTEFKDVTSSMMEKDNSLKLTSYNKGYFRKNGSSGKKIKIIPKESGSSILLDYIEREAPSGYFTDASWKTIKIEYNENGEIENAQYWNKTNNKPDGGKLTIIKGDDPDAPDYVGIVIKNDRQIDELEILKTDIDNNKLDRAEFKVTLTNVKTAKLRNKNYKENNGKIEIADAKTDENGNIILKDLVIKDANKDVEVTIEETEAPSSEYKKLEGRIGLKITKSGNSYKVAASKTSGISDDEFKTSDVKVNGNKIVVNIKNISLINLTGKVWLDGQQGEKVVAAPNGKIDNNEKGIDGVKVHLFSVKDNKIIKTTTTSNGGIYEFKDITKTAKGYKVQFEYNGILYDDVGIKEDSKAAEDSSERNALNDKFKTINKEGANGSKYGEHNATYFKNYVDGSQPVGAAIKAYTSNVYKRTTKGINCGLTEKYFDLAVGTDLSSATVAINGKTTNYTYAQVLNGELQKDLQAFQGVSANTEGIKYNLYLYQSDYNYRISDYKTDTNGGIANKVNPEDSKENDYDIMQELEVYVTYSVVLKNQSKHEATVTKFEYIYDEAFEPYNIASTDKYTINIDSNNRKITFASNGDGLSINEPDYRNQIDLTFKVKKDANGNIILKDNCTNTVEILEYRTNEGGLIDIDSVPGNGINNEEDDWDKAPALNIAIDPSKVRTIGGTVFEDENKNGNNDDNIPVNDVIVQLIELKTIKGKYYEYIWQQTKSGSKEVLTTTRNGYDPSAKYKSDASGDRTYQFKDFIPGNYIIRFIYGDGSTYDIETEAYKNSADNVKKYNGQDYKSTIDNSYKEEWYNPANYNGKSTARDNEARRLEVMAYSTTINKDKGEAIKNKTEEMLNATWMCAETSKVNVAVDTEGYSNMNFGLALRPQTKLTLEKHITGLKITPQGTGVQPIVDAKVVNGEIQGITTVLARMDSTRTDRGFWKVETDIEELAQGATVELEYTYTIKNESEEDYLTEQLINAYKNPVGKTYDETLLEIRDTIKQQMRNGNYAYSNNNTIGQYLGQYYYKQEKNDSLKPVLSTVNTIEDNLNNNLKLVEETDMKFEKNNSSAVDKTVYDVDGNEKTEKIETVIRNKETTGTLAKDDVDSTKTVKLTTTLSSSNKEISYPTYIGEIVEYTNAAGRKDMEATPENLSYVHSGDTNKTMKNSNEHDEFWGETLLVSKPTGENKQTPMQIVIISISGIAVIGVGIILVKKFVLKK